MCDDLMEIEIHGPVLDDSAGVIEALEARIATLTAEKSMLAEEIESLKTQMNSTITKEEADQMIIDTLVQEIAFGDYINVTLPQDVSISHLRNGGRAVEFDVAGFPIYNEFSPEPAFYLPNAHHDSLLQDMQGDIFKFPESGNSPEDVEFALPDPPPYSVPSDLYFKTILEIAALLRSGAVDCTTIVQAFIDRTAEFDPYLAIVVTPLYERALQMAQDHQELLDSGTDLGPLMCIPFGVKDHHQIFDDDPTTYGNILYGANIQKTKSTLMQKMMSYGAIPIAKTVLGTFASGSVHGWGNCMSPYLNGQGAARRADPEAEQL